MWNYNFHGNKNFMTGNGKNGRKMAGWQNGKIMTNYVNSLYLNMLI